MAEAVPLPIIWTPQAITDTKVIVKFLLAKFTQKEVDKLFILIANFESLVSTFPQLYQKSTKNGYVRRAILYKRTTIFYTHKHKKIFLISVLDNRMDPSKRL